jgi:hypothetical protein
VRRFIRIPQLGLIEHKPAGASKRLIASISPALTPVTPPHQIVWLGRDDLRSMGTTMTGKPAQVPPPDQSATLQPPTQLDPSAKAIPRCRSVQRTLQTENAESLSLFVRSNDDTIGGDLISSFVSVRHRRCRPRRRARATAAPMTGRMQAWQLWMQWPRPSSRTPGCVGRPPEPRARPTLRALRGVAKPRGLIGRSIGVSFECDFGPLTLPILCAGTR